MSGKPVLHPEILLFQAAVNYLYRLHEGGCPSKLAAMRNYVERCARFLYEENTKRLFTHWHLKDISWHLNKSIIMIFEYQHADTDEMRTATLRIGTSYELVY